MPLNCLYYEKKSIIIAVTDFVNKMYNMLGTCMMFDLIFFFLNKSNVLIF